MKHSLYLLLLLSITIVAKAQKPTAKADTVFLDEGNITTKLRKEATKYRVTQNDSTFTNGKLQRTYYKDGQLFSELYFHLVPQKENPKKTNQIKEGIYREWFENGTLKQQVSYSNDKYNGEFTSYWRNKQKRRIDHYIDGKLTEGYCYDSTGVAVSYYPYEVMPVYPGGEKELLNFIGRHLRYPVAAQENGVQGTVLVRFIVTKTGKVDKIKVIRSLSVETDIEACLVISTLPDWTPGKVEDEPVDVYYTLPIKYRLMNDSPRQLDNFNKPLRTFDPNRVGNF